MVEMFGLLQQLQALPLDIFVERATPEQGTKTTQNTPPELITESGLSKKLI